MTDNEPAAKSTSKGGLIVKAAVVCVFVVTVIVWQQYYFNALDDVDSNATTLWNWPAIVLVAFGVLALIARLLRFSSRFRAPPDSKNKQ
jgi:uncharacterized BrkB/YihY/UPF0761 family membrane protein